MKAWMLLGATAVAFLWLAGYTGLVFCIGLLVANLQAVTPPELWKLVLLFLSLLLFGLANAGLVAASIVTAYRIRRRIAEAGSATGS